MRLLSTCFHRKYSGIAIIAITSIALIPAPARCQRTYTSAQFLLIPPDARGKSLGEGGSVFSTGAISAYYNPALLVTAKKFSGEFNYCKYAPELSDDLSMINIFLAHNMSDLGCFGIGYSRFDHGESFGGGSSYDYTLGLWTALDFDNNKSVGVGFKYIKSKYEYTNYYWETQSNEASSLAFDFGFLFRNLLPGATWRNDKVFYPEIRRLFEVERDRGFLLGLSVANLGKGMALIDPNQRDPLPKRIRVGLGYQAVDSEPAGIRLTVDATKLLVDVDDSFKEEWSEIAWSYGLEITSYHILNFRFGRIFDRDSYQRFNTIGFGVGPEWLCLDYSKILGDIDDWDWNRRSGEYSISIKCNISPEILKLSQR